jgi:hypothetical protein
MGMAHEADLIAERPQGAVGVIIGLDVIEHLGLIEGGVNEGGPIIHLLDEGKVLEEMKVVTIEVRPGPFHGLPGVDIEERRIQLPDDGPVVISCHDRCVQVTENLDARSGIGPIAHDVANLKKACDASTLKGLHGHLQRFEIAVDITQNAVLQKT